MFGSPHDDEQFADDLEGSVTKDTTVEEGPPRPTVPRYLDDGGGRAHNPVILFGGLGVVAVLVLLLGFSFIHSRLASAPATQQQSALKQESALDPGGGGNGVVQSVASAANAMPNATPTPFQTRTGCPATSTPTVVNGVVQCVPLQQGGAGVQCPTNTTPYAQSGTVLCRGADGSVVAPSAGGSQQCPTGTTLMTVQTVSGPTQQCVFSGATQGNTGTPLPCGAGTMDQLVQTPQGVRHECVATSIAAQQQQGANVGVNGAAPQGRNVSNPPPSPTPLPSSQIAFNASPLPSADEQQANADLAGRNRFASNTSTASVGSGGSQQPSAPSATPVPESGAFVSTPHYIVPTSTTRVGVGTVLTIRLKTKIESDLPGPWCGQQQGDILDTATHSHIVIPNGTTECGTANEAAQLGVGRLPVLLQTATFPDGREFAFGGLSGSDAMGASGVPGAVNNHTGALLGAAGFLTFAAAAEGILTHYSENTNPYGQQSVGQSVAGAAGSTFSTVVNNVVQKRLNQPPTITIEPGATVQFLVTTDLPLVPYYEQQ